MKRPKKTPMYQSIITNQTPDKKTYNFIDYTVPALDFSAGVSPPPPVSPPDLKESIRETNVIRKIESLYRSQLLNIQESKEEDCAVEEIGNSLGVGGSDDRRVLGDASNRLENCGRFMCLKTVQTLGGEFEDETWTENSNTDRKCPVTDTQKKETGLFHYQRQPETQSQTTQNSRESQFDSLLNMLQSKPNKKVPQKLEQNQSLKMLQSRLASSSPGYRFGAGVGYGEFTSDDLVEIMAQPYRSRVMAIKRRARVGSGRII